MTTGTHVLRRVALIATLLLPAPIFAAGFTCAQPITSNTAGSGNRGALDQLDEVVISASKSTSRTTDLGAWLKRLEGQYRYEGYVDLCGNGNAADQRPVTGDADCTGLYVQPGNRIPRSLYCMVNARWPEVRGQNGVHVLGGKSSLRPAVLVYGVVPDLPGIQFMQIDSEGMTTHAKGKLTGDTLRTTESCSMGGSCQTVTRITAREGSKDVVMLIDVEIDSRRVLRRAFLMRRVSNIVTNQDRWTTTDHGSRAYTRFPQVDLESVGKR